MKAFPTLTAFACAAIVAFGQRVDAAPGDLDLTFGGTGKVTTDIGDRDDQGESVAIQSDGKIVVAGTAWLYPYNVHNITLVRYNPDGSLDTGFNGTGIVSNPSTFTEAVSAVAIQTDGKIVVAGASNGGDYLLARYNANGSLDTSFNGTGKVITDLGGGDGAASVAVQSDGKIVAVGSSYNFTTRNGDLAVVRYNTNGSLDTSFNGTGIVKTAIGDGNEYGMSVKILGNGKIVAGGSSSPHNDDDPNFAVVRYNPDGSLDTTFNGTGKVTTDLGSPNDYGESIAVQNDGKVVLAGTNSNDTDFDFALVRYNIDGGLDTSFGYAGKVITDFGGDNQGHGVAVQLDGKILVAGSVTLDSKYVFGLARYNPDGSLDTTFHGTGLATAEFIGGDYGQGVALQSDGNIVVAGFSSIKNTSDIAFATARFTGGTSVPEPSASLLLATIVPVMATRRRSKSSARRPAR